MWANLSALSSSSSRLRSLAEAVGHAKLFEIEILASEAVPYRFRDDEPRGGTKWSHRIDPHAYRERDWIETDLLFTGTGKSNTDVGRPSARKKTTNATCHEILTDGKMTVLPWSGTAGFRWRCPC